MSSITTPENAIGILSRIINPDDGSLRPEAAEAILGLRLPDEDRDRVNELAAKARAGTLTEEERAALDEYERATALVELLQSKARLSLKRTG